MQTRYGAPPEEAALQNLRGYRGRYAELVPSTNECGRALRAIRQADAKVSLASRLESRELVVKALYAAGRFHFAASLGKPSGVCAPGACPLMGNSCCLGRRPHSRSLHGTVNP